eukprot:6136-Eustigmatos_ZCMA.PRE.1
MVSKTTLNPTVFIAGMVLNMLVAPMSVVPKSIDPGPLARALLCLASVRSGTVGLTRVLMGK